MAKPKVKVLVKESGSTFLEVYCDDPRQAIQDIMSIEGILDIYYSQLGCIAVGCDPRYDRAEIAQEIKDLLTAEVPAAFMED